LLSQTKQLSSPPSIHFKSHKSCLEENLEEKLPQAKAPNLDQQRPVLLSQLVVSIVFSVKEITLNESVLVHQV
jgi:hypothetical protein